MPSAFVLVAVLVAQIAPATLDSRRKQLTDLLSEHWEYTMRTNPEYASVLGDKRYNDQLSDVSAEQVRRDVAAWRGFLKRAEAISTIGFSDQEIWRYIIPARTQRHRKARKERLTVEESDRLVRLTRIQALAEDVLGGAEKANRWLREPLGILDGKAPLELVRTDSGARVIEQILAKIDWGAAA